MCNRCGKELAVKPVPTTFELGFRKEEIILCEQCARETKDNEKKHKEKYKKEIIEILNKYFNKILN
jgi:hypothetical protein